MSDYRNTYSPWTIMSLPDFWRGALLARQGEELTQSTLAVHRLLAIAERGEDVFESEEFSQWIGCRCRGV